MHGKTVHVVIAQIFVDAAPVCLTDQRIAVFPRGELVVERARSADTAAVADHSLDKIFGQFGRLQKQQGFLALLRAVCFINLRVNLFVRFL